MIKVAYIDQPCERCGSKKRVSRVWKEKVLTYSGKYTQVECSQIVCTNRTCQVAFDKKLVEETKKKEVIRMKREENDAMRKANSLLMANKSRTKKLEHIKTLSKTS